MDAALRSLVRRRAGLRCEYCLIPEALVANIAGVDSTTQEVVRLFNPRVDDRKDHFRWDGPLLAGLSPIGRATIRTLRLNHPERVVIRASLQEEGVDFSV